jgi:hypothetical protein
MSRRPAVLALLAASAIATAASASTRQHDAPPDLPRVQQADLEYVGAFLLPEGTYGSSRFGYGGAAPAYYKDGSGRETMFMEGHAWYKGNAAQILIPPIVNSRNLGDLHRATVLQPFDDITDGELGGRDGDGLGSLWVDDGELVVSSYVYYDADGGQERFIGRSGLDLSEPDDFRGFYPPAGVNPGRLGRYVTTIPAEWRTLFGGPALNGACCLSIIGRTNSGPGVSVFDFDDVGTRSPVPFTQVLGYPLEHPVRFGDDVGDCAGQSDVFNCTTNIVGMAFPAHRRSVLFFGRQGIGPNCYKCNGCGGYCAPPYVSQVWAYDANDLLAVKNGSREPWEVEPYALWRPDFELNAGSVDFAGGTFDPATSRVFLVEANGEDPIVHVLRIRPPEVFRR